MILFFFARYGRRVLSVDQSRVAVEEAKSRARAVLGKRAGIEFMEGDITSKAVWDVLSATTNSIAEDRILIYSRFVLHSLTLNQELDLLEQIANFGRNRPIDIALEFRTTLDQERPKVTPAHFRRFLDPEEVVARAASLGLETFRRYSGTGLAVYGDDDAHVERIFLGTQQYG